MSRAAQPERGAAGRQVRTGDSCAVGVRLRRRRLRYGLLSLPPSPLAHPPSPSSTRHRPPPPAGTSCLLAEMCSLRVLGARARVTGFAT